MSIVTIVEIISLIVMVLQLTIDILAFILCVRKHFKARKLANKKTAFSESETKER